VKRVIGVCSVKGGVGKTLIAVNLAHHFGKVGKTGLLDADIDSSNEAEFLGNIGKVDVTRDKQFILPTWNGIKVWSMSLLVEKWRPISMTGDNYAKILNDVVHFSDWGNLDYLIVDLPAGAADSLRGSITIFAERLAGNVIVIQPAFPDNARRVLNLHVVNDIPIIGLIENMSFLRCDCGEEYHIFGESIGENLAKEFNTTFLGKIPLIPVLHKKLLKQEPIIEPVEPFKKTVEIVLNLPEEKIGIIGKIKEKAVEASRNLVEDVVATVIGKIYQGEINIPELNRFIHGLTLDFRILDGKREKNLIRWFLAVRDGKLIRILNPKKVDFICETTFRTLARVFIGRKKLKNGKTIPFDAYDAWFNEEIEIVDLTGVGSTNRAVDLIKTIFLNREVMDIIRQKFGSTLEKFI